MPASVTVEGGGSGLYCFSDASLEPPAIAVYNPDVLGVYLVFIIPHMKGNYQNSVFFIPTTPGDIIAIISSFKSNASSGHDGVSSKLVKHLKYALSFPLSIIINNSLAMGLVPNMAKLARSNSNL